MMAIPSGVDLHRLVRSMLIIPLDITGTAGAESAHAAETCFQQTGAGDPLLGANFPTVFLAVRKEDTFKSEPVS
jgi:hypothetical protein